MARRPCLVCGVPTDGGRCPKHALENPNRVARKRVYDDPRHKQTRSAVLKRDNNTCLDCGHHDPTGRSLVCDHTHLAGVLHDPNPFNADHCATRCLTCSGRKDGARSAEQRDRAVAP